MCRNGVRLMTDRVLRGALPPLSARIDIGGSVIAKNEPVLVMAEMAQTHEGQISLANKTVKAASEAGADCIKFQMFKADSLAAPDYRDYESLREMELAEEQWQQLFEYAREQRLMIVTDVFDPASARLAFDLGADGFKIHSTDTCNPSLITQVAEYRKPMFLSCGGSTFEEVQHAVDTARRAGNDSIVLVHGFQAFPTEMKDTNLLLIPALERRFGALVSYHGHFDGGSQMAIILPLMAISAGAVVIETHITLDRSGRGTDYESALDPGDFKEMVEMIRDVQSGLGTEDNDLSEAALKYRNLMKKVVVAAQDLPSGRPLQSSDLAYKRSSNPGQYPAEADGLLGKATIRSISKNEPITLGDLAGANHG